MRASRSPNSGGVRRFPLALGFGCAAILIVIAVVVTFGFMRVYRSAFQLLDNQVAEDEVEAVTYEFALALHGGDVETAYGMLGEAAQERHTPETLRAEIEEYEQQLAWSRPFPVKQWRVRRGDSPSLEEQLFYDPEDSDWRTLTYFRTPDSEEEFTLTISLTVEDDGSGFRALIDEWEWETKTDDLQSTSFVRSVKSFAMEVLNGEWEEAGRSVHPHSELGQGGRSFVVPRLKETIPPLPEEASVHVVAVRPKDAHLMAVDIELRGSGEIQELTMTTRPTIRGLMEVRVGDRRLKEPTRGY